MLCVRHETICFALPSGAKHAPLAPDFIARKPSARAFYSLDINGLAPTDVSIAHFSTFSIVAAKKMRRPNGRMIMLNLTAHNIYNRTELSCSQFDGFRFITDGRLVLVMASRRYSQRKLLPRRRALRDSHSAATYVRYRAYCVGVGKAIKWGGGAKAGSHCVAKRLPSIELMGSTGCAE